MPARGVCSANLTQPRGRGGGGGCKKYVVGGKNVKIIRTESIFFSFFFSLVKIFFAAAVEKVNLVQNIQHPCIIHINENIRLNL